MSATLTELLAAADDSAKVHALIGKRLKSVKKSWNALCLACAPTASISTFWRWKNKGAAPNVETLRRVDAALRQWEKPTKGNAA